MIMTGILSIGTLAAHAAEIPQPSDLDQRVRYITYHHDEVTTVHVRRGVVTRIVLADDEHIVIAASGFLSDCLKVEAEWCIRADTGTNQIWVKPKDHATHNNLEIRSDKRDYSFEFNVLPDNKLGRWRKPQEGQGLEMEAMYRVIFRYPIVLPPVSTVMKDQTVAAQKALVREEDQALADRLEAYIPRPLNWAYSMEVLAGGEDIAPALVFDDGRFTYFSFPPNREIPALFLLSPAGEETRVNVHMEHDLAVVQRMARRFVLRLGSAVVGVWNDAPELSSVPAKEGVTVPGVRRVLRRSEVHRDTNSR